jgi:hypothetical protein
VTVGTELAASNKMKMLCITRIAVLLLAVHSASGMLEVSRRGQSDDAVSPGCPSLVDIYGPQGKINVLLRQVSVRNTPSGRDGCSRGELGECEQIEVCTS